MLFRRESGREREIFSCVYSYKKRPESWSYYSGFQSNSMIQKREAWSWEILQGCFFTYLVHIFVLCSPWHYYALLKEDTGRKLVQPGWTTDDDTVMGTTGRRDKNNLAPLLTVMVGCRYLPVLEVKCKLCHVLVSCDILGSLQLYCFILKGMAAYFFHHILGRGGPQGTIKKEK